MGRRLRKGVNDDVEDYNPSQSNGIIDDDDDYDDTRASQSSSKKKRGRKGQSNKTTHRKTERVSPEEFEQIVVNFVRYALALDAEKIPLRRANITKFCMEEKHKGKSVGLDDVIKEGKKRLRDDFGLQIFHIVSEKQLHDEHKDSKGQPYFIKPDPNIFNSTAVYWSDKDKAEIGFLSLILSTLIQESKIKESELWEQLLKLNIEPEVYNQYIKRTPKEMLDKFIKQTYLQVTEKEIGDDKIHIISVGPRIRLEAKKLNIIRALSNVRGVAVDKEEEKELMNDQTEKQYSELYSKNNTSNSSQNSQEYSIPQVQNGNKQKQSSIQFDEEEEPIEPPSKRTRTNPPRNSQTSSQSSSQGYFRGRTRSGRTSIPDSQQPTPTRRRNRSLRGR